MTVTDLNPHETGALVRMTKAGWPINEVAAIFGKTTTQVKREMRKSFGEREEAERDGRPVHE